MIPPDLRELADAGIDPETVASCSTSEKDSASRRKWEPNAVAVLMRASELKRSGATRWVVEDKRAANQFLDEIGYKRPFICVVSLTVAMLFEKCPHYFVPYARRVELTELKVYGPHTELEEAAALTWLGDGTNFASAILKDSTPDLFNLTELNKLLSEPTEKPSEGTIFRLLIPNIKEQFGDLLE